MFCTDVVVAFKFCNIRQLFITAGAAVIAGVVSPPELELPPPQAAKVNAIEKIKICLIWMLIIITPFELTFYKKRNFVN